MLESTRTAPVVEDLPARISPPIEDAVPARREALDRLVFSAFLSAGFLAGALLEFNAVSVQLLLGGLIAAPFCVWRPLREAWRRVPRGRPATLPEHAPVDAGPNPRRLAHAMHWTGWQATAAGMGYGLAWLSDRMGTDVPGAVIALGPLLGDAVVLYRVRRWERRHRAELLWAEDGEGEVVPCVRAA